MGRTLITLGLVLVALGFMVLALGRFGLHLGRLPGDLAYRGRYFGVFLPLGTSILLSILLSLVLYALSRLRR